MRLTVAAVALGLLTVGTTGSAAAQLRASRPQTQPKNLPRLLIANPHTFNAADSAAAVRVGSGMRDKMEGIADKWYTIIQRNQMNDALQQYGYPIDAVLPPLVARQLGSQLQARAFVLGTVTRGEGGRLTVDARVLSGNDQTGHQIVMTQTPGQSPEDLGNQIANALKGAFNALPDAKTCEEHLNATPPDFRKAAEAANKALKSQPNHGPAELCLGLIAVREKKTPDEILVHFKNATEGDGQSLEAWGGLLGQYQAKHDTANVVETYRQLILIAPNNQKVVEEAVRYFIAAGKPELGEEIASEAIGRDPSNPDMFNLRATACLVQSKWKCAIGAMEQVFAIDTAKADTFNLQKMIYVASQDSADAVTFLRWAREGARKFPDAIFLGELVKAYELNGPVDSVVVVTRRLVQIDKSDLTPVLRAVRALVKEKRYTDALELGQLIEREGQPSDKSNLGIILAQEGGLPILQTQPVDNVMAAELGRRSAALLEPGTSGHQLASYVIGFGLLGQIAEKDALVVEGKSCDAVTVLETLVNDSKMALTAGQPIQPEVVSQRIEWLTSNYGPRIAQMKKAYCKGK